MVVEYIQGFYIGNDAEIYLEDSIANYSEKYTFRTKKQAKSALAYAQLTQLMALPEYNDNWEPDWSDLDQRKWCVERIGCELIIQSYTESYFNIAFKSKEVRDKFIENNYDLLKEYFELD